MTDKLNDIIGRLNRLMKDIDEYNNENKDQINVGMYLNYKGYENKYNNRIYYYRNMDKNKMLELMSKESDVKKYIKSFQKRERDKVNSEINKSRKSDKIIRLSDKI